ncbi:hypothetical protein HW537_03550 [Asaia siamensis]
MSLMNISLCFLAFGLWASIFLVRFRREIREWIHNRFGHDEPPEIPEGGLPEVPLPFRYTAASSVFKPRPPEPEKKEE